MKPAQNKDAEACLASAVVLCYDISHCDVHHTDFTVPKFAAVWAAGQQVLNDGLWQTDGHAERIFDALRSEGAEKLVGGYEDLVGLTDALPGNLLWHAREVKRCAGLRRLSEKLESFYQACGDGTSAEPDALAEHVVDCMTVELKGARAAKDLLSARDIAAVTLEDIKARARGEKRTVTTGFAALDNALGGLEQGGVYVVGARPKMGKTALALSATIGSAKRGAPAYVSSHEMSAIQLGRRAIAHEGEVDITELRRPSNMDAMQAIGLGAQRFSDLPISFRVGPATLTDVIRSARKWRRSVGDGPALWVIDYLQLVIPDNSKQSREQQVAQMSATIKRASQELKVATILLAQLNRGLEARDDKRPKVSDLRESGSIEQDADAVLFLYRPAVYEPHKHKASECELIIGASRESEVGTVNLHFEPALCRFADAEEEHP